MGDGYVIALEIVVYVNLPVAINDVVATFGKLQALKLETLCLPGNLTKICRERLGLQIEIHKDELFPRLAAQRHHTHGAAVEKLDALDVGRADEAAIQRVGPTVILAAQNIFAAAAERHRPGAMAANVTEGTQRSLVVANDDDWLTGNVGSEKTFGIGDDALHSVHFSARLAESSNELPGAMENARLLDIQNRRIGVKTRRECLCALDLLVDVEMKRFRCHDQNLRVSWRDQRSMTIFDSVKNSTASRPWPWRMPKKLSFQPLKGK